MKIYLAEHRGFCYGVKRAVETVERHVGSAEQTVTLGPIIHNPQLVNRLAEQGIGVAKHLDEIQGGTVIIRSHGVGPGIYKEAQAKNLHLVDATCPHVKKAQQSAFELVNAGFTVVIVGERNHPEVKSIVEWAGGDAAIVESVAEAAAVPPATRLGIVAQTTFPGELFNQIVDTLKSKCDELRVERTICTATDLRQQAAVKLAATVDMVLVVGGKNSANTARLADLCRQAGAVVHHIETADELQREWFKAVEKVGVTAGASTPDWIIQEVCDKMEEFNQMFNEEVKEIEAGSVVRGKIISVRRDEAFVDIGYKAEGVIPLNELAYPTPLQASDVVSVGDEVSVYVIDSGSADGNVKLSKVKADKIVAWNLLEAAAQENLPVDCQGVEVVKGGLAVTIGGVRGFIPASQVDLRFVEDLSAYIGQSMKAVPVEIDAKRQRVVLSRKVILQQEQRRREEEVFNNIKVGSVVKGTVQRLVDFGAFVDIGGVEGLIHISDLAWHRVKNPAEILSVGDEVEVFVQKVDLATKKVSLSLKQIQRDPWFDAVDSLVEGQTLRGKVTKTAKFGAFVEIKPGLEGLVHLSELSDKRVVNAEDVVKPAQEVNVKLLGIDKANKRISLSIIKAQEDAEQAEFRKYLSTQETPTVTIGDKLGHLLKNKL